MFIKEFELAKSVAAKTAKMLQKIYISDVKIISSKGKDIKTEADYAAHKLIIDSLSHTDIPIVSEEGDYQEFNIHDSQWIIDPIDGTYNLSRGFSEAAVSISLWDGGLPVFGVIHHLFSNDIFTSFKNHGAFKNNEAILLNSVKNIKDAILATGFPTGRDFSNSSIDKFILNVQKYKKIRMLGSAALMLSYVASGYFDVYHEEDIYIWDVAAGLAIILEAKGKYIIKPGSNKFQYDVKASNKTLIDKV
jgi:fructose-1,6-bisphosphatase/inositol monophosphatase family enzyme